MQSRKDILDGGEENRQALEERENALGKEHAHTLESVSDLALVLQNRKVEV